MTARRRVRPHALALLAAATIVPPAALAADSDARFGRLAWSAFTCSTFAEMSGKKEEQVRLFAAGYEAGQRFIKAVADKAIPQSDLSRDVPMGVLFVLAGPTNEFILGRIFESASTRAYELITQHDSKGYPLEPAKYVVEDKVKAMIAQTKYLQSNCAIIGVQ